MSGAMLGEVVGEGRTVGVREAAGGMRMPGIASGRLAWVRVVVLAACVLGAIVAPGYAQPAPARVPEAPTSERWYALEMMGAKAGWMRSARTETDVRLTTSSMLVIETARGEQGAVTMRIESEFVETAEGTPVSMRRVQRYGTTDLVQSYVFHASDIEVTSTQAGQTTVTRTPRPEGAWLAPGAAERYVRQRFKSGAKEITVRTLSSEYGVTPVTVTRRVEGRQRVQALGREIEATKWTVENSLMPAIKTTEWTDDEGEVIRSVTPMGPLSLTMTVTTQAEAMAPAGARAPDAMASTFVKGSRAIPNPRRVREASYVLSVPEGTLDLPPTAGAQVATRLDERRVRVDVLVGRTSAPDETTPAARYLASTALCRTDDEVIAALAAEGVRGVDGGAAEKAEALRRLVFRHIRRKTLDVGFATASEAARTREGDCSEHAVLLAAVLRAAGIPARAVAGLIYADEFAGAKDIFGYHMWTQALVDVDGSPRWVDLDATFPAGIPMDATHIALAVSDLGDDDPTAGLLSVATVMGRLAIEVERTK